MPDASIAWAVVSLQQLHHLAAIEVPEVHVARSIATGNVLVISGSGNLAGVALEMMALETLLAVEIQGVASALVIENLTSQRLTEDVLSVGRESDSGHGCLRDLGKLLDGRVDAKLPDQQEVIITSGDEALSLIKEGDGVDRTEVGAVGLDDLGGRKRARGDTCPSRISNW